MILLEPLYRTYEILLNLRFIDLFYALLIVSCLAMVVKIKEKINV